MFRPDPGLTSSTPYTVCVCVCVYTHIHPHTLSPASKIEKTQNKPSTCPSVQNNPPHRATRVQQRLLEPPHPGPPTRINILRIHERMCSPCSDCVADEYGGVKDTSEIYTPACTGAQDTCLVHTALTAKIHIHPHKLARATV